MKPVMRFSLIVLLSILLASCNPESSPTSAPSNTPAATQAAESLELTLAPTTEPTQAPTATPTALPPQGLVQTLINRVDAHPLAGEEWQEAKVDMLLYHGGEVWAQEASTALVKVFENDLVRVAPNTIFSLTRPEPEAIQLDLQEGQIWIQVDELPEGSTFEVKTPSAAASVRGTRFSVRVEKDGKTVVSCVIGKVEVRSPVGVEILDPKKQTTVFPGSAPLVSETITHTEMILWNLASGSNLDVVVPVGHLIATYIFPFYVKPEGWSWDSHVFAFTELYLGTEYRSPQQNFLRLDTFTTFLPGAIPTDTNMVAFNPAADGVAWKQFGEGGDVLCTSSVEGSEPVCFGELDSGYYSDPIWSPDGDWLLYRINQYGDEAENLYRVRPDGSEMTQLTFSEAGRNGRYTWSPDGTQIAYSYSITDNYQIPGQAWVMNADGSDAVMIFDGLQYPLESSTLAWSPDGQHLALPSQDGIFLVTPDGSQSQQIPGTEAGNYYDVRWSPTATGWPLMYTYYLITEESTKFGGNYFVPAPGAAPETYYTSSWGPIYSPDGSRVAFGFNKRLGEDPNYTYQANLYFYEVLPLWP